MERGRKRQVELARSAVAPGAFVSEWGITGAMASIGRDLYKFRQGGAWDAQRVTGTFDGRFRDYATVAIGLYAAGLGMSVDEILTIENEYAERYSKFQSKAEMDQKYQFLPRRNVYNTNLGYRLLNEQKIK